MVTFMDICFCDNKECKKRKQCQRALEYYTEEEKRGHYFTMASFNCNEGKDMFLKRKKKR